MRKLTTDAFAEIRPTKIQFYLRYMEKLGYDADQVLEGTPLNREILYDSFSLIEIPIYIRVVSNIMRLTKLPSLAFDLGKEIRLGDLGILGHAFAACNNAAEGISFWQDYNGLFFGNLIEVREWSDDVYRWFEFIPRVNIQPHLLQFFMEEKLNIDIFILRQLNQVLTKNLYFSFTYPAPSYAQLYSDLLDTNVKFNADKTLYAIDIRDPFYSREFKGANKETFDVCKAYLDEVRNVVFNTSSFLSKLRFMIKDQLPNILSVTEMANNFKCSHRTFSRHLVKNNTTYQKELAKIREEMAKNYLASTAMSLPEISLLLGFTDAGSFSRGFKSWTGMTITEYKASLS